MFPTPDICQNCDRTDISNLYVCNSRACTADVAYCGDWCDECRQKVVLCADKNPKHISCWDAHVPRGKGASTHQKQPARDQVRINEVFDCEKNPERQSQLHAKDKEARWFMVDPRSDQMQGEGILRVTNRFEELLQSRSEHSSKQFPSLVSFIGETGTGKSTLIRALIKFFSGQEQKSEPLEIPVTRLEASCALANPTSSGVHLYKDPATFASPTPILFADCEGSNSGAGLPTSHSAWGDDDCDRARVARAIPITSPTYENTRRQLALSVKNSDLYSRFLYAFSDVVCLVTRNPQRLSKDISDVLLWAYRGLRASINQVQAKTLIIIVNAPSPKHDPGLMDPDALYKYIFDHIPKAWEDTVELAKEREKLNRAVLPKEQITTTKSFILRYFQSIRVCYIPPRGSAKADEMHTQCELLRTQITESVNKTSKEKDESWTRYSVRDLSRLLDQAFHHFATDGAPFDFYKATRKDNPNPQSMQDHIMNMLRNVEKTRNMYLTNYFPKLVASSILSNCLRGSGPVLPPEDIWAKTYEEKCTKGIENFYKEHADCQFQKEGVFCVIKKHVHKHAHRSKDGSHIGNGDFLPSDTGDLVGEKTRRIGMEFKESYNRLCSTEEGRSVERIIAHRREVLRSPRQELWGLIRSYKTCFSCLLSCPDHVLPCGHALCEECISDFGKRSESTEREIEISECIFCGESWGQIQRIQTKPPCAGVRVLTLDGGGIRGILELVILKVIHERIGLDIRFDKFFDLVVGTSTGGIIALGIFVKGLGLDDMIERFEALSVSTFTHTRGPQLDVAQRLFRSSPARAILYMTGIWESIYRTTPLREGIQEVVGDRWSMFGSAMGTKSQRTTRVALMTVKESGRQATAITNYSRSCLDQNNDFERAEAEGDEIKCWEAGLCTSAAPFYFKAYKKVSESATMLYLDGGIFHNNPINWAVKERDKIWPHAKPDVLLSLGTGYFPNRIREVPVYAKLPSAVHAVANSYFSLIDCESTWSAFQQESEYKQNPRVYHRLNHTFEGEYYYSLDQHQAMKILTDTYKDSLKDGQASVEINKKLQDISDMLIAKLFFFEPTKECKIPRTHTCPSCRHHDLKSYRVEGNILCRLPMDSLALKILVQRIDTFSASEISTGVEDRRSETQISSRDIFQKAVLAGGRFQIPYSITGLDSSEQSINVKMTAEKPGPEAEAIPMVPISGFPRKLSELVSAFRAEKARRYKWFRD